MVNGDYYRKMLKLFCDRYMSHLFIYRLQQMPTIKHLEEYYNVATNPQGRRLEALEAAIKIFKPDNSPEK